MHRPLAVSKAWPATVQQLQCYLRTVAATPGFTRRRGTRATASGALLWTLEMPHCLGRHALLCSRVIVRSVAPSGSSALNLLWSLHARSTSTGGLRERRGTYAANSSG